MAVLSETVEYGAGCVREKRMTKPGLEPGTSPFLEGHVTTTLPGQ